MNILLRGSWQTVNIGDIAHTPSIIRLLKEKIKDCNITLWASNITETTKNMIQSRYPDVKIITGRIAYGNEEFLNEIDNADFLLHGSAAHFSAYRDVKAFVERTGKPFGCFGITCDTNFVFDKNIAEEKHILDKAEFIYYRDSKSVECAKRFGINAPIMEFGCDVVFAFDYVNDVKAIETMKMYGLIKDKFVCCIPRCRYTPYWEIKAHVKYDKSKDEYNKKMLICDHEPIIEAINKIVNNTDLTVFLCPEDETQIKLCKEVVFNNLDDRIKNRVVYKKEFWHTDEALSVYKNSVGLFGCEMHSPIMCVGNGIPAIVARWKEQTTKGYMFDDLGMGKWLFDFDKDDEKKQFADTVLEMVTNREESLKLAQTGRENAFKIYDKMCKQLINSLT